MAVLSVSSAVIRLWPVHAPVHRSSHVTHFPDGAVYSYLPSSTAEDLCCVGWLGRGCEFSRGEVSRDFLDRLAWYCLYRHERQMRGIHDCDLCVPEQTAAIVLRSGDVRWRLGSAEITVAAAVGRYASPNLIVHYVTGHQYRPPADFIEAVMRGPADQVLREWTIGLEPDRAQQTSER